MSRLDIHKTYKLYIGGKFPRTESGRYYPVHNNKSKLIANMCLSSRKDFRNAVVAARKAQSSWAAMTALNKGQILYRIAEMLEGRKEQFIEELRIQGQSSKKAREEVEQSIDRLVYYAGWSDKFQQIFSSVNPVSSAHFNFSCTEPMGVLSLVPELCGQRVPPLIPACRVRGNVCKRSEIGFRRTGNGLERESKRGSGLVKSGMFDATSWVKEHHGWVAIHRQRTQPYAGAARLQEVDPPPICRPAKQVWTAVGSFGQRACGASFNGQNMHYRRPLPGRVVVDLDCHPTSIRGNVRVPNHGLVGPQRLDRAVSQVQAR